MAELVGLAYILWVRCCVGSFEFSDALMNDVPKLANAAAVTPALARPAHSSGLILKSDIRTATRTARKLRFAGPALCASCPLCSRVGSAVMA